MNLSLNKHEFIRFISDLHLTPAEKRLDTFYLFLNSLPKTCKGLFILGDFFDYWIGLDIHQSEYQNLQDKLKSFHCPIFFLPGNRDFLIEDTWLKDTNLIKLSDPAKICINDKDIMLTHGDQLCLNDKNYQIFRRITRNHFTRSLFLNLPKAIRKFIFKQIRNNKQKDVFLNKYAIDEPSVEKLCNLHQVNVIIHGHIHMPGIHVNGQIKRIVLDEWMAGNNKEHNVSYLDINEQHIFCLNQMVS